MQLQESMIKFSFEKHQSSKGTPLLYIKLDPFSPKISEEQKKLLKIILNNYFFFSKEKRMWGFIDKGENAEEVSNYLTFGALPERLDFIITNHVEILKKEYISIDLKDFEIRFISLKGRPLFTFSQANGMVEVTINLRHWFFTDRNNSEIEIVKKMVLSHVIACYEFTSPVIDSFNNKLLVTYENLYGRND